MGLVLLLVAALVALPVLTLLSSWLQWDFLALSLLQAMWETVLPDYLGTTLLLCVLVSLGVVSMGTVSAAAVTLFDFPLRRTLEWALLLPLAMPAYVVAYAYTDFFQYSGPAQNALREVLGLEGRVLPEIRSVWGASCVLALALYPYVYLLARAAFADRAVQLMEAARLLGAGMPRRLWRVALPLARPAIAAGTALALMETLGDYGVSSYFGIQSLTAGIYKAWLVMDSSQAAAQLATVLLVVVLLVLQWEQHAQRRMRYASVGFKRSSEAQPLALQGWRAALALIACALPVLLGFVLPVVFMLRAAWQSLPSWELPLHDYASWTLNSLGLALLTALLTVFLALLLLAYSRTHKRPLVQGVVKLAGLGYAIPGAVVVVGLLLPVMALQRHWPHLPLGAWLTTTLCGLIWAYLVRFIAVALQSLGSGYSRVPQSLDENARVMGVSGWALIRRVHLPLLKKPMAAALMLVLVDVMKELPATLVLRPFNTDTLAVMAYQLARDERLGEAALPSLTLVLVGLLPVIWLSRTLRRSP